MSKFERGPWGSSVRLAPDLWRVRLKNPRGNLMVNTFVHRGDGEVVVVDPGWPWTLDELEFALGVIGVEGGIGAVSHWVYTHTHVDHMGAACLLQGRSHAPHHVFCEIAPDLARWHAYQDRMADWSGWVEESFAPPRGPMMARAARARRDSGALSTLTDKYGPGELVGAWLFELGSTLRVGSMRLEVLDARGHDPRHVAFLDRERSRIFSGDAVLPIPTPLTPSMGDDVELYEQTLARLGALEPELGLVGHGTHIGGADAWRAAVARSLEFVTGRRDAIVFALAGAGREGLDLWQLCLALTPNGKPLEPQSRWGVHMATTSAHVNLMTERGVLERMEGPRWRMS